uniref:SCAN box domain-containing protein n=1 Tax=Pseudonaja textilis TaxID=8673 RepID=A0A670ZI31_PSETE
MHCTNCTINVRAIAFFKPVPSAQLGDKWIPLAGLPEQSEPRAFNGLETVDQEDYGKVKAAILRGAAFKMEAQRQRFRQFRYQEVEDPRRVYGDLRELCYQWLKPEKHTKEEILELLILEQFLAILPPEIQTVYRVTAFPPTIWVLILLTSQG